MNTDLVLIFVVFLVGAYADPPCYTYGLPNCIGDPNKLYGFEENKHLFWQCVELPPIPFLKSCRDDLVFDPVRETCDFPDNVPDYPPCPCD